MSEILTRATYDVRSEPSTNTIMIRLVIRFPAENEEQNRKLQELVDHIENDGLISVAARQQPKVAKSEPDQKWGLW